MSRKIKVGIIGSGNIGMDLFAKIQRSDYLEVSLVTNNYESENIKALRAKGVNCSTEGEKAILENPDIAEIYYDCTTASIHKNVYAPVIKKIGKKVIDMTPAKIGVQVVPAVNLAENIDADNINLISCGGQAAVPIVRAVADVVPLEYAEHINTGASVVIGPGARANADEYILETREAIEEIGKAKKAKAILAINPAQPPIPMHNTLFMITERLDEELAKKIEEAIYKMVESIQTYVPGFKVTTRPQYDFEKRQVTVMLEILGMGDFLPEYAGNLDITTQAAVAISEAIAKKMLEEGK